MGDEVIPDLVNQLRNPQSVFDLFKYLNYPVYDPSYQRNKESLFDNREIIEKIVKIYQIAFIDNQLPILLIETGLTTRPFIRQLIQKISTNYQYFLVVLTENWKEYHFIIPEKERIAAGEIRLKLIRLILNSEMPYHTDLEILKNLERKYEQITYRDIWLKWKEVFSVERVTEEFFEDYKKIFFKIRNIVQKQNVTIKLAHEFTQQLLNRLMFNYFISKKGWMGDNLRFMAWFWDKYQSAKRKKEIESDTFFEKWLQVLFLEAFNKKFYPRTYFTDEINSILQLAPFLNGGLFKENDLDRNIIINLKDDLFQEIFNFLNKYNFTIREDLPLDVEVAVDPEMLGYVYESLANVAEEIYQNQDLGIFYTPRIEVDFMCRRSLVEYLHKQIPEIEKDLWYHLLFDSDKKFAEKFITKIELWKKLEEALDNLKIVDPACGSGAFLVGLLTVMTEVYHLVNAPLNRHLDDFNLKKRIISTSLYGVDVMPWAVHSAELRLWLQLIVETNLPVTELQLFPLLPNFNLKLRMGDSLVQELRGINLRFHNRDMPEITKRRLNKLSAEKEKFYNNDPSAKFKTDKALLQEEIDIYKELIQERIVQLRKWEKQGIQSSLVEENLKEDQKIEKQKEIATQEVEHLRDILRKLNEPENKPFVWDVDFAEIFGDKGGFDIVIGNPPYVRQEKIAPPNQAADEITLDDKRIYKDKLQQSIRNIYPFMHKLDGRSDYYIYFYFHGLNLLNPKGTFCFITSNSWLDVGYGKDLQEFLLKYVPITAIYDNHAKRSFKHADVNTIIALLEAPQIEGNLIKDSRKNWKALDHKVKFVAFKKPFQEVINTSNLLVIEKAAELIKREDFRVFPVNHETLLEEGWEYPEVNEQKAKLPDKKGEKYFSAGKYAGNKWGGKYLRAPEIFFTILEKGKGKLVRLGDIAEVRRGFTTGANEFFYVEDVTDRHPDLSRIQNLRHLKSVEEIKQAGLRVIKPSKYKLADKYYILFLIEEEYLKPVIISPRNSGTILIKKNILKNLIVLCYEAKKKIKTNQNFILDYIDWGEKQGYNKRSTCKSRSLWYNLGARVFGEILFPMIHNERLVIFWNKEKIAVDHNLFEILSEKPIQLMITLSSSIQIFFRELFGRSNLGQGALKTEGIDINRFMVLNPDILNNKQIDNFETVFEVYGEKNIPDIFSEFGLSKKLIIRDQEPNPLPDRKALDDIVFNELGLTEQERKEVYWSVAELVKNRLDKASSI
ncbi:MAG: hypothetical protein A2Y94_07460 [Caldithrix sp. RBG_13_44_9]|nr:MAG: hypothetical protein A2Y94_07460 [Caldithrix sp. RBG_13_44_9]